MVPTTAPAVHRAYCEHFGHLHFDEFERAYTRSSAQVTDFCRSESKEIRNQERMRALLRVLGHRADEAPAEVLESLTGAHLDQLAQSFEVLPETIDFVAWAARYFRLALISNFDHSPALFDALDRFGIGTPFEAVVVSDDVGWRMPHRIIFERALGRLGIEPEEALFIGDRLYPDVYGAINSRLDSVWIANEQQDSRSLGFPAPTYKVGSLLEVVPLLDKGAQRGQHAVPQHQRRHRAVSCH